MGSSLLRTSVKTGIFINLDRCPERRETLLASLRAAGMNPADYCRFAAIEPSGHEAELKRGLKSRGELGIWLSLIRCLELITSHDFAPIVHILEDDIDLCSDLATSLASLVKLMLEEPRLQGADILFLDYLLTRDLCTRVLEASGGSSEAPRRPSWRRACGAS